MPEVRLETRVIQIQERESNWTFDHLIPFLCGNTQPVSLAAETRDKDKPLPSYLRHRNFET